MKKTISIIAACDNASVIGSKGELPWHLSDDLKRFKALTLNKPIIMGRKTFESLPCVLPGRENIIITRNKDFKVDGCTIYHSLEDAIENTQAEELMIVGGGQLYQAALPLASKLYLTLVNCEIEGDTFFPYWKKSEWREIERIPHQRDEKHEYGFEFVTFKKT